MSILWTTVLRYRAVDHTMHVHTVVHRGVAMAGLAFSRPSQDKKSLRTDSAANAGGNIPSSPPAQRLGMRSRWRDPRLAAGVALVAASIVAGSWVVASADDRVTVWSAAHDLAPGTEIRPDDLVAVPVRLEAADQYLTASVTDVVGKRIVRQVASGELVPVSAIGSGSSARRLVTVPVEPMHAPTGLAHGDQVDVYVSAREGAADAGVSRLVLGGALVSEAGVETESASGEVAIVLDVAPEQAAAIVNASRSGVVDLVRVPVSSR